MSEKSLGYVTDLSTAVENAARNTPGSDDMPNMFLAYPDTAYLLDTLGVVANLNDYFTQDELNEFYQGFLQECFFGEDKELKIVPVAKSVEALFVNTTDFEAFTAVHPEISYDDLTTIEDIIEVAKVYYEYSGGKAFYGRDSLSNYFVIGAKQLGVDLFDYDEDGNFIFNLDQDVIRKLYDNYYVPTVSGYFYANGKFRSSDLQTGDLLCYTGSSASSFYFPQSVIINDTEEYEIDCKVMTPPNFADAEVNYTVSQGAGFVVTKSDAEQEEACVKFLKWFTDSEISKDFSIGSGYLPVKNSQLNSSIYEGVEVEAERQALEVSLEIVEQNHSYTNKPSLNGFTIRNILDTSLDDLAQANLENVKQLEAQGVSHFDAVAQYTTDEIFEDWYANFCEQIQQVKNQ